MDDNGCGGPWLKLARVARGERPRVLDLFSGCGGLSLGLHRAGFEILAGVEIDPHAAASFGRNFRPGSPTHGRPRDITCLTPAGLCDELGLGPVQGAVDVVVGGPPCQSFARIGRAKLRTIREHPQAFLHDPRAGLHERWLAWVRELAPLAVLIENVPDALNVAGRNVAEEIAAELDVLGFLPRYTLLNAALYGVPQMRDRLFLMAIRREFALEPSFPPPSHCYRLPSGLRWQPPGRDAPARPFGSVPLALLDRAKRGTRFSWGGHGPPSPRRPAADHLVARRDAPPRRPPLRPAVRLPPCPAEARYRSHPAQGGTSSLEYTLTMIV
jgi:site-specific DNA-cytosine methylase